MYMHTLIILILIIAWIGSIPGWRRIRNGDYRRMFWLDFALDLVIVTVAIFSQSIVLVVTCQIIVSALFGGILNKRFKILFDYIEEQYDKNKK